MSRKLVSSLENLSSKKRIRLRPLSAGDERVLVKRPPARASVVASAGVTKMAVARLAPTDAVELTLRAH